MAGVELTFDIKEAEEFLGKLLASMKDMTPAYKNIGEHMKGSILETFQEGGRPEKWPELSQATIISRMGGSSGKIFTKRGTFRASAAKKFGAIKPLVKTGRLLRSIKWKAGKDYVVIGTNVIYAAIQQFGGMAGRGRTVEIPARPFIVFQDEDYKEAAKLLEEYIMAKGRS